MDAKTIDLVLETLRKRNIGTLDLTGGSPEMNPEFERLVVAARNLGVHVMDRCNPTILVEPGYEHLASFFAEQALEVVASLPCYQEQNVDRQRGKGVYEASIEGLRMLNSVGYGQPGSPLKLNLVYNPDEPMLPPDQQGLEADYKTSLFQEHGIQFNQLFALANMPISRFGARLLAKDQYTEYMNLLRNAYQPQNLDAVMCRSLVSVDYEGYVYDCDFNQMLAMPLAAAGKNQGERPHLRDLVSLELNGAAISVGEHCYACTAGQGSSCGGALAS